MGWIRSLQAGVRALRDKRARNVEIEEELASYVREWTEEKVRRGMSPEDAARAVRREAGSAIAVRQQVWNAGWEAWLDRLWSDVRYTFRRLSRMPGLLFVLVLSIGIGIAANATVFAIVSKFILQPLPVGDPGTLLSIMRTFDHGQCCNNLPAPVIRDVRSMSQTFSDVAAYDELLPASMGGGAEPQRIWGQATSANYFDVAQVSMAAGRGFAAGEEKAPVIVIGYRLWQQMFRGDPEIAGRQIQVSGHVYTVVGVAPRGFRGLDQILDPQFWVPLGDLGELTANSPKEDSRTTQWLRAVGRLKPGVTREQAAHEMDVIAGRLAQMYPATDKGNGLVLESVGDLPARDKRSMQFFLMALSAIAFLVLCIACANVANLLLAQGAQRQREMAVRLALGSTRGRLMRQILMESTLIALAGGTAGVLLSLWATYALSSFRLPVPVAMDLSVHVDWRVLLYSLLLSIVAGVLCGFVPSWAASRPAMPNALKGEDALARPGRRWSLREVLVATQITLSLVLLCGAGLFLRSLEKASKIDVGFRSRGLVMMSIDPQLHRYTADRSIVLLKDVLERIAALPGIRSATLTDGVPLSMGHRSDGFEVPGRPKPQGQNVVELYMAGPEYFETMGIPRIAGRDLANENAAAMKVGVVNQEFVRRFFQGENPVGHTVNGAGVPYQIVGVVGDTKSRTLGEQQRPVLYRSIYQNIASDPSQDGYTVIARYEGDPAALTKSMEGAIHAADRSLAVFNVQTMEEHMNDALFLPRLVGSLFAVFGIAGVLLASIGLYGVMSYAVSQRTKEIGVRMALGARASQVQAMVVRGGLRLVVIAMVLGVPLALAAAKLTRSLLYGIAPWDTTTFTVVPLLLAAISLLACWIPSRRASRVDPMEALRTE
ncbi:ABC transporter permease [Edaphobacter sp. 12200R-103]|uniref:ABC transporter permease n=1 Tax=Edaphobacter sp. 12200R-103 TaxID=2703788 RepID=UPI00138BB878|nr:ABC transporter permease [Edaphobacter sp. 12200R-103]QHS52774.1 ABC transporter permease [Edaphobacter sp. 12200R-103]